jgi:hypothetical protein
MGKVSKGGLVCAVEFDIGPPRPPICRAAFLGNQSNPLVIGNYAAFLMDVSQNRTKYHCLTMWHSKGLLLPHHINLAHAYCSRQVRGDLDGARELLEKGLELHPSHEMLKRRIGMLEAKARAKDSNGRPPVSEPYLNGCVSSSLTAPVISGDRPSARRRRVPPRASHGPCRSSRPSPITTRTTCRSWRWVAGSELYLVCGISSE